MGVKKLDEKLYREQVLKANTISHQSSSSESFKNDEEKPWLISIVVAGQDTPWWHSTYIMKTLYFLQRDYSDRANYGYIDSKDEFLREAFENDGLPQTVYIKGGKVYYLNWQMLGINRMLEFMERHEEMACDVDSELREPRDKLTIYPEYYKKFIGLQFRALYNKVLKEYLLTWLKNVFSLQTESIQAFEERYVITHPKTAAKRIIYELLAPLIALIFISGILMRIMFPSITSCLCCCIPCCR